MSNHIICIGDVHGHTANYKQKLKEKFANDRTIQLGDMGVGFSRNPDGISPMEPQHRWLRGNHDNPEIARRHPNYLGEYGYLTEDDLFFISGAFSIDYMMRVPGRSWWYDEELSQEELYHAIDLYMEKKPKYVVSHEAPSEAAQYLLTSLGGFRPEKLDCATSRTSSALQAMFNIHKPKEWIFGHYHINKSFEWRGTKFTCVDELDSYRLELT